MSDEKKCEVPASAVVKAALSSGLIDQRVTISEIADRLGGGIDEVAGYVLAWDRYVLVVGKEAEMTPIITMKRGR